MKSFVLSAATLASIVSFAQAAIGNGGAFGLIVIASGSPLQYATTYLDSNNKLAAGGSGNTYGGLMLPDGRVRNGGTDMWLSVDSDQSVAVLNSKPMNWGVDEDNHLTANGFSAFVAVPNSEGSFNFYTGSHNSTANSFTVVLRVEWISSSSSSVSTEAPQTSGTPNNTATATQSTTSGVIPTGTITQVNGVAAATGFAGAAVAALAGALFL